MSSQRILIVDDQISNVRLLQRILDDAGFHEVRATTDSRETMTLLAQFQPDIVLLDLSMPNVDGYSILSQMSSTLPTGSYLPVLVLTADINPSAKRRALSMGAHDFLAKPFDLTEVLLRIRNLLETRRLHQRLTESNQLLEHRVQERTVELENAKYEIMERLALAGEYRDDATGEHTRRVGRLAASIAYTLGLPADEVEVIRRAAPLHDIGKIGIPDQILLKAGPLTREEFSVMQTHTTIGGGILSNSPFRIMQTAESIARTHHEKWDGAGYPSGLSGENIPLEGRIVALADVVDALLHPRPYKHAWHPRDVMDEIARQSGRHFDPQVVAAFQRSHVSSLHALQSALESEFLENGPMLHLSQQSWNSPKSMSHNGLSPTGHSGGSTTGSSAPEPGTAPEGSFPSSSHHLT